MSTAIPEAVFLDTQVFEAASFNFQTTSFKALQRHLSSGRLKLVIADITISEVHAHIEKHVAREIAALTKFQKEARVLRSSRLPELARIFTALDPSKAIADLKNAFDEFLSANGADVIGATEQDAAAVFEKYFAADPPFGGANKKHEFPDAFVIEALIEWTEDKGAELFVVSGDKLFRDGCAACKELHPKNTLAEVLDHVASDDAKLAQFIRSQVSDRIKEIGDQAASQFQDLGFHVIDEWGDAEVEVTATSPGGDPDIIDLEKKEATVHVPLEIKYDAHLSYDDSSTGVWDSEDKQMLFMDHREVTVRKSRDATAEVRVTFDGLNPDEFEIVDVDLIDPTRGFGIRPPSYPEDDD